MSNLPTRKRIATQTRRNSKLRASRRRGRVTPENTSVKDQKLAADEIRRAIDDGMQDLRIKKPD